MEYGRRVSCKCEKNKHLKKIWLFSIRKWELGFQHSSCPIFKTKNILTRHNSLVNFHVNVVVYFHIMFKALIVDLYVVNTIEPQWTSFKLDIIYIYLIHESWNVTYPNKLAIQLTTMLLLPYMDIFVKKHILPHLPMMPSMF